MILKELADKKRITAPDWLPGNTCYLVMGGSQSYGTAIDGSDYDLVGCCFPPKTTTFPWLAGEIPGFGHQHQRFEQWQQAHVSVDEARAGNVREYDFAVYGIVAYFNLLMQNNPNIIDSLFVRHTCVLHCSAVGNLIHDNRKMFLHKGCYPRFRGYSISQMSKVEGKKPVGTRAELVERHGYDVKFASNVPRLLLECEQILTEGDLDLQRDSELLRSVRRGEWTLERLREWVAAKEIQLETAYANSALPAVPREQEIKELLLRCLTMHYGDLSSVVVDGNVVVSAMRRVADEVAKVRHLL